MFYYVKICLSLGLKLSSFFGGYQVLQGNQVEWVIPLDAVAVHVLMVKLSTGITLVLVSFKL